MKTVVENAGAQKGFLILDKNKPRLWAIEAKAVITDLEHSITQIEIGSSLLEESKEVAINIIHYVARSPEVVILNDAATTEQFAN